MYMSGDWGLLTWNGIQVNVVEMHLESAMRVEMASPGAGGWAKSMAEGDVTKFDLLFKFG